jgi:hypothetical protein
MSKEYAAVKIVNPIVKNHLVRLAPNQKLNLLLSLPEYDEAEINLLSDFLTLEDRQDTAKTISLVYKQIVPNNFQHCPSLFLGELHVISGSIESSLCLLLQTPNAWDTHISVVNPNGQACRFDHDQMINIFFLQKFIEDFAIESGTYTKLRIQSSTVNHAGFQLYSFALDDLSLQNLCELPRGRYDSGKIIFKSQQETFNFSLILNWKEKKKLYSKVVLPIINRKRNAVRCANVSFKKLDKEIDTDCNFVEIGDAS